MRLDSHGVVSGVSGVRRIVRSEVRGDGFVLERGMLVPEAVPFVAGMIRWLIRMHIVISQRVASITV